MNIRLITFASLLSAIIGGTLGFCLADLSYTSNESQIMNPIEQKYERMDYKWVYIGVVGGLVVGIAQEILREMSHQKESEK